jgi:hypothetical protein
MNAKSICLCALVACLLGAAAVRAQYPRLGEGSGRSDRDAAAVAAETTTPGVGIGDTGMPAGGPPPRPPMLSKWITGNDCCCGPIGRDGPIDLEVYARTGVSLPIESGTFSRTLEAGWVIEGGARSVFFDQDGEGAWTIDLGLGNVKNQGQHSDLKFPLLHVLVPSPTSTVGNQQTVAVPRVNVSIANLNRTYANGSIGREIYLVGCAREPGPNWRAGIDVGGRWGSAKLETHELRHRSKVIYGVFVNLHTDVEIPYGACIFQVGARAEWDHTWTELLQGQNDTDLMDVNFLFTAGVRY